METKISRRKFLKTGCLTAAAVGLTMCGGGALAANYRPAVETPASVFGTNGTEFPILVTYATRAGSTAGTAARIAAELSQNNHPVDLLPVKEVTDISRYGAVILGSAIRMGALLPEAITFLEANQATLQQKIFSVFVLCMTLEEDTPENQETTRACLDPVRSLVKPAHEGLFAGVVDVSKLNLLERLMVTTMDTPTGDYRNWNQIVTWAQNSIL
jgi:menaquinone-dependent protoporphyrinogen oxidase